MKISFASDLHLDFYVELPEIWKNLVSDFKNENQADILILAGDTGEFVNYRHFLEFFNVISQEFERVIFINGNHEFYNSYFCIDDEVEQFLANWDNFFFLEKTHLEIGDCAFIGSTFWTAEFPDAIYAAHRMNDYRKIMNGAKALIPDDTFGDHENAKYFTFAVAEEMARKNLKPIVISHHSPTEAALNKSYIAQERKRWYCTNLEAEIAESRIHTWIFGHVHNRSEYQIGRTNLYSNCLGYPYQIGEEFSLKTIEV